MLLLLVLLLLLIVLLLLLLKLLLVLLLLLILELLRVLRVLRVRRLALLMMERLEAHGGRCGSVRFGGGCFALLPGVNADWAIPGRILERGSSPKATPRWLGSVEISGWSGGYGADGSITIEAQCLEDVVTFSIGNLAQQWDDMRHGWWLHGFSRETPWGTTLAGQPQSDAAKIRHNHTSLC